MDATLIYRGPLSSCNYDCHYCPFAKNTMTREELEQDEFKLQKFFNWVVRNKEDNLKLLFTPWGEALIHDFYQNALSDLSHLSHVEKVVIQTNLSCKTTWMEKVNKAKFALWCTYHPSVVPRERFLEKCSELQELGVQFSVGMVGVKSDIEEIQAMRKNLDSSIYLWVNAYKDELNYYSSDEIETLNNIDSLFHLNLNNYESLGKHCWAGESSFSINGDGDIARCHFIKEKIGNIYEKPLKTLSQSTACTMKECTCYIGYTFMKNSESRGLFAEKYLERIPERFEFKMLN